MSGAILDKSVSAVVEVLPIEAVVKVETRQKNYKMETKTIIIEVETAEGIKNVDRLTAKFDEIYGEVLPLTGAIGELEDQLYQMALAGEQNTKAFKDVTQRVGELKKTIIETDLATDSASQTLATKMGGALNGVASGFSLAQGAMGAFGISSEDTEAALLKVQSAMAMTQGIQGIRESIPAFIAMKNAIMSSTVVQRILNIVMAANPVGLIIAGVTALAGAIALFSMETDKTIEKQKELQAQIKRTNELAKISQENLAKSFGNTNDAARRSIELLKAKGATQEQVYNAERDLISQQLRQMDVQRASGTKLTKEQYQSYKQLTNDKKILDAEYSASLEEAGREASDKAKEANDKKLEDQKKFNEEQLDLEKKQREDLLAEELFYQSEFDKGWQKEQERIAAEKKANEDLEFSKRSEIASTQQFKDEQQRKDEELAAYNLQREKDVRNAKIQMASDAFGVLGELANAFAGKSEDQQRRAFNINKATSIAQATISTYQGATAAFASTAANPISIANPAAPFIAAGIAVASGIAKVAMIARTQFGGGGASSGGGSSSGGGGAIGGGSAPSPANFNIVGNSGTNQLIQGLQNAPIQAYVVGGDVTTAQSLNRNKIATASI